MTISFNPNYCNLYCQSSIVTVFFILDTFSLLNFLILLIILTAAFTARVGTVSILSLACSIVISGPEIPSDTGLPYLSDKSAINLAAFDAIRIGTWPGALKLLANSSTPPESIFLHTSAILEIVSALSVSVIPVKVSQWLTDIEKEGLSPYGDLLLVIFENIEFRCVRDLRMSLIYKRPSFWVISLATAIHISPPAWFLINAIWCGLICSAAITISTSSSRPLSS